MIPLVTTIEELDRIDCLWMDFCDRHAHGHELPTKRAAWSVCEKEPCLTHRRMIATVRYGILAAKHRRERAQRGIRAAVARAFRSVDL